MNFRRSGRYTVYIGLVLAAIASWLEFGKWLYPVEALAVLGLMLMWLPRIKPATPKLARARVVVALLFTVFVLGLALQKGLFSLAALGIIALGLAAVAAHDLKRG